MENLENGNENLKIYLAGKITGTQWRYSIVDGLSKSVDRVREYMDSHPDVDFDCMGNAHSILGWNTLPKSIFGKFDYVGPYPFLSNVHKPEIHSMEYWYDSHGNGKENQSKFIFESAKRAIESCDLLFAWIDSLSAYGTIFELGYACAMKKDVVIAISRSLNDKYDELIDDKGQIFSTPSDNQEHEKLWFPLQAGKCIYCRDGESPSAVLYKYLQSKGYFCESPIEKSFWDAAFHRIPGLVCQHPLNGFRLDFAIPEKKIAIELDGHEFHKTKEQRTHDAERERKIQSYGWRVIRFTGSEIHKDVSKCVNEVRNLIG